ncbi:MAG TPA: DUF6602 domain-containing protein [Thermoguttaceae bacterium]|nr:DUF6602 domain-containing protein [Thermoguttaceae bacterium]
MTRTLIQKYATSMVSALIEQVESVCDVEHRHTKGLFRELFVKNVLERYLTAQFGIGSGIVVNQRGDQSRQTDIIIYDNRILPPFIREELAGIFPVEAVIATMEVRSVLKSLTELKKLDVAARQLRETVAAPEGSAYCRERVPQPPGAAVIAFRQEGLNDLRDEERGKKWLQESIKNLWAVCVVSDFSWMNIRDWSLVVGDTAHEETKRFIAVILDNVRTQAERNYHELVDHRDWLGIYTRDNPALADAFGNGQCYDDTEATTTTTPPTPFPDCE